MHLLQQAISFLLGSSGCSGSIDDIGRHLLPHNVLEIHKSGIYGTKFLTIKLVMHLLSAAVLSVDDFFMSAIWGLPDIFI